MMRDRLREFRLLLHELPPILKELHLLSGCLLLLCLEWLGCRDIFRWLWHR